MKENKTQVSLITTDYHNLIFFFLNNLQVFNKSLILKQFMKNLALIKGCREKSIHLL
jgi:hypothetical protein